MAFWYAFSALLIVGVPLLLTLVIEVVIAAFFRLSPTGLGAVAAVNFITNPVLTAVIVLLQWLGERGPEDLSSGGIMTTGWSWPLLGLLEAVILVAEWRMLVWVLRGSEGSARKLLALAIVMNVVSATLGTFALRAVMTGWL